MFDQVRLIKKQVCTKWGVSLMDLEGTSRHKMLVRARFEAMGRCRNETQLSFSEIGFFFGRRDHTTIMHAVKIYRSHPEYFSWKKD